MVFCMLKEMKLQIIILVLSIEMCEKFYDNDDILYVKQIVRTAPNPARVYACMTSTKCYLETLTI